MENKNTILMGFVLGAIVPVLGYLAVELIFDLLTNIGLMEAVSASSSSRRFRTMLLLGICANLIPFNFAKNRKWDQMMRGIIFPTIIYTAAWIYKFYDVLFG